MVPLIVGMVIMGKHLNDVNTFKEYVNTQIDGMVDIPKPLKQTSKNE